MNTLQDNIHLTEYGDLIEYFKDDFKTPRNVTNCFNFEFKEGFYGVGGLGKFLLNLEVTNEEYMGNNGFRWGLLNDTVMFSLDEEQHLNFVLSFPDGSLPNYIHILKNHLYWFILHYVAEPFAHDLNTSHRFIKKIHNSKELPTNVNIIEFIEVLYLSADELRNLDRAIGLTYIEELVEENNNKALDRRYVLKGLNKLKVEVCKDPKNKTWTMSLEYPDGGAIREGKKERFMLPKVIIKNVTEFEEKMICNAIKEVVHSEEDEEENPFESLIATDRGFYVSYNDIEVFDNVLKRLEIIREFKLDDKAFLDTEMAYNIEEKIFNKKWTLLSTIRSANISIEWVFEHQCMLTGLYYIIKDCLHGKRTWKLRNKDRIDSHDLYYNTLANIKLSDVLKIYKNSQ